MLFRSETSTTQSTQSNSSKQTANQTTQEKTPQAFEGWHNIKHEIRSSVPAIKEWVNEVIFYISWVHLKV